MAWRAPTIRDLAAKLTQVEMDAFRASPDFASGADPVTDILELTAENVRGYCRTNKQIVMSPTAGTIPEGLMSAAMDIAAFDVLKRLHAEPNEARKSAWEKALELLTAVGKCEFIPESYVETPGEEGDTASNRAMPGFTDAYRRKILNNYPMI